MRGPLVRKVRIIGVPMDLGADRRGVDMGPSGIRIAGVAEMLRRLGYQVLDVGDVQVPVPESRDKGPARAKYLPEIREACETLRELVRSAMAAGECPIVLGGDHSIAIGTVAGVAEHHRARQEHIGLIWVDAHADMNTPETSPTGNVHGMPLAHVLGLGEPSLAQLGGFAPKVAPENVALIGIRDLDDEEKRTVRRSGVNAYTMRDIDERGMSSIIQEAITKASAGTIGFHVSFDLDGMDPSDVPGVGTPVKGGIDWREGNLLLEAIADSRRMLSFEITELNPILDVRNESGRVAVDMIASAFGKSIL
ncbi:MAG: arginase [Planctomycetes bacterium]|nr:arginase [Planctomycetota bacterium]